MFVITLAQTSIPISAEGARQIDRQTTAPGDTATLLLLGSLYLAIAVGAWLIFRGYKENSGGK